MSIQVSAVNKSYGSQAILHDVAFSCEKGDILAILGPSGAGKSTLLRLLNLLETPDSGHLTIANESFDFSASVSEKDSLALRKKVGMVFQQYHLWPHLNVMDNLIEAPIQVLGWSKNDAQKKALDILTQLHLANKAQAWPLQLSGGQQQRVAIARALMMEPDVLLFDEPTAALDPEITTQVINIIKTLSHTGITQVIVTHEVDFAKKVASHVLYLENGVVIEHGDAQHFVHPSSTQFADYLGHS